MPRRRKNVPSQTDPAGELETPKGTVTEQAPSPILEETPPAPETADEMIPLAPIQDAPAPDAAAALGALDAVTTVPPAPGGNGAPLTGEVSTPRNGKQWSDRKIQRAKAKELRDYVRELQKNPPPASSAAAPGAAPAPAPSTSDVAALIRTLLPAVNAIAVHFGGKELNTTADEQKVLADAWAPAAAPHFATIQDKLPLAPALAATLGVYTPKVFAMLAAKSAAAANAPGQVEPAPAGVVSPGVPQSFGGPQE